MKNEYMWINSIYKRQIKNFYKQMNRFCKKEKIDKSFPTFVFYNWNGMVSSAYVYLFLLPKVYLVNSKSFMKYYSQLNKDFQDDLLDKKEIKNIRKELQKNKQLQYFLKQVMQNDSII